MDDVDLFGDRRLFEGIVYDEFLHAVNTAFDLFYQQRRAELRPGGAKGRGFSSFGIHEVSYAWGRVSQCERLLPELLFLEASLRVIREEAIREAEEAALMHTRLGLVLQGAEQPV
jgi:hypothetical protein